MPVNENLISQWRRLKEEPVDEDEAMALGPPVQPVVHPLPDEGLRNQRLTVNDWKMRKYNENGTEAPTSALSVRNDLIVGPSKTWESFEYQATSHPVLPSQPRDPRLRNKNPATNQNVADDLQVKRKAFLLGTLNADEITKTTGTVSGYHEQRLRQIKARNVEIQKRIGSNAKTFFANIPSDPIVAGGFEQNRSPLYSSNHNALFVSQATPESIQRALVAQRYRNIPHDIQDIGQRTVGVDLDRMARAVHSGAARQEVPEILFSINSNSRTIGTQTEKMEKKDSETQTSENTGGFMFIPDIRKLNDEQKAALKALKQALNVRDDTTTGGILERLKIRRGRDDIDNARREERNGSQDSSEMIPPTSLRSKYANAVPK